jgi:hypothetical protein
MKSRLAVPSLVLVAGLAGVGSWSQAEVSGDFPADRYTGLLLTGLLSSDDPTPYPSWQLVRLNANPVGVLNSSGDVELDGRPAYSVMSSSGWPDVVWSSSDGSDYELVTSRLSAAGWSRPAALTINAADDHDPSMTHGSDGARHVAWWRQSLDEVGLWIRSEESPAPIPTEPDQELGEEATSSVPSPKLIWGAERRVTPPGVERLRPAVAFYRSGIWIASQGNDFGRTWVYVTHDTGSDWHEQPIAASNLSRTVNDSVAPDIEVRLTAERGKLWLTWWQRDGMLAYAVHHPDSMSWSAPQNHPYRPDVEDRLAREWARQEIRRIVLASP